jgi:putative inorganic carbon (hco3(-)) transporter
LMPLRLPAVLGLLVAAGFVLSLYKNTIEIIWPTALKAFGLFFLVVSVGIGFATNPWTALNFWSGTYWKVGAMTVVLAWVIRESRDLNFLNRAIVVSGCLVAVAAIHNKLHGIGLVEGTRVTVGRDVQSALGDPNDLASVLLLPLSFSAAMLVHRQRWLDIALAGLGVATCVSAILFTESRGGFLGVLALLVICATQLTRSVQLARSKWIIFALGISLAFGMYAAMGIADRNANNPDSEVLDESAAGRVEAWTAALGMAASHPLSGVGLNNFTANYLLHKHSLNAAASTVAVDGADRSGKIRAVHSMWLEVLAEAGFPGFFTFITMIGAAVLVTLRLLRETNAGGPGPVGTTALAVCAGLIGFGVSGSFLTHAYTWQLHFLVAVAAAMSRFIPQGKMSRVQPETCA